MREIHHHILFDILLYLPVMSLLRFKFVCKAWLSIIESSAFINEHLKYNSGKEHNLIVLNHHWHFDPSKSIVELVLHSGTQYENCDHIDFDRLFWHPLSKNIQLCGSCNGIVCLQQRRTLDIALWNPTLNQLRPLPPPLFSNRCVKSTVFSCAYGAFGIDVRSNDYRVLKIFPIISEEHEVIDNQVEIYSLRENRWRIIWENIALPFLQTCQFDVVPPCYNGKCFWICSHSDSPNIITFDFTDEVFGTMSLPDGVYDASGPCKLDIYNDDKIVYIRFREDENNIKLEMWMLCEGGLKESWSKMYMAEPSLPLERTTDPIGLSKNGEYFICKTYSSPARYRVLRPVLCLYNLHTQQRKSLGLHPVEFIQYNPSLISLKKCK